MKQPLRRLARPLLITLATSACGIDLGLGTGATVKDPHGVGVARAAVSTRLSVSDSKDRGILLGGELEGRSEWSLGSRWNAGLVVGWGDGPATLGGKVGCEVFADFGLPLGERMLGDRAFYAGGALAVPISLERTRSITDMNRATWILRRRLELVPQTRYRFYRNSDDSAAPSHQHELAMLLSLRLRFESDLY